jgi:hypothetical protein
LGLDLRVLRTVNSLRREPVLDSPQVKVESNKGLDAVRPGPNVGVNNELSKKGYTVTETLGKIRVYLPATQALSREEIVPPESEFQVAVLEVTSEIDLQMLLVPIIQAAPYIKRKSMSKYFLITICRGTYTSR